MQQTTRNGMARWRRSRARSTFAAAAILFVLVAPELAAAPAGVPGEMSYQGVLLDDQGAPRTGPVDLAVRIYDQAAGGTLLYKQGYPATPLADGTFTLVIGPTGAATDVPDDPATTSLVDVFSGDLVSGPGRFFELTVGGDPALGRIQILSAPLAMRAASAGRADTADSASRAQNVIAINGLDPAFVTELFEHFDFDGQGPGNLDPSEGTGDTDGDGLANFIDPDNDDDGLNDAADLAAGGDINLVTPRIFGVSPDSGQTTQTLIVTITGANFEPGMSVSFGTQDPVPTNVTPTRLDVQVGPQVVGSADVTVTRPNGESATAVGAFVWNPILGVAHRVNGARLETFDIRAGNEIVLGQAQDNYNIDTNGDLIPDFFVNSNGIGVADWAFAPDGGVRGVRCVPSGSDCIVYAAWDLDGDDLAETQFMVETVTASSLSNLRSADVAVNGTDGRVLAYVRGRFNPALAADVVVAVDRDADDDWDDPNERVELETGLGDAIVRASITSSGSPVVAWDRDPLGSGDLRIAVDLNGDGDFDDNVGGNDEVRGIAGPGVDCFDVTVDGADRVALVYQATGNPGLTLLHDRNGDGDFGDAGEVQNFSDGAASLCAITRSGATGIAIASDFGAVTLRTDENDDGDFDDMNETLGVTHGGTKLNLATDPLGNVVIGTDTEIFVGF